MSAHSTTHKARYFLFLFGSLFFILLKVPQEVVVKGQFISPIETPTSEPFEVMYAHQMTTAIEYYSSKNNIGRDQLHVGGAVIIKHPSTNRSVWQATVASNDGKQSEIVTVDLVTGEIVDGDMLKQNETEQVEKLFGKMDPNLSSQLATMKDDESISVAIRYSVDIEDIRSKIILKYPEAKLLGFQPGPETDLKLFDTLFQEIIKAEEEAYTNAAMPIVTSLQESGFHVSSTNPLAPLIYVTGTKAQLMAIAAREEILKIYSNIKLDLTLNSTASTNRAPTVWTRGINGTDIKVAVIEEDGIYFSHSYLLDGAYFNPGTPNIGEHATLMAGIIASTHPTYRGIAYGVPALYSANAGTNSVSDLESATSGAVTANASVLNLSVGGSYSGVIDDFAKFQDHMAFNYLRTVVAGAGNCTTPYIGTPAIGYNVIAVGGISDKNTPSWGDDQIWTRLIPYCRGSA